MHETFKRFEKMRLSLAFDKVVFGLVLTYCGFICVFSLFCFAWHQINKTKSHANVSHFTVVNQLKDDQYTFFFVLSLSGNVFFIPIIMVEHTIACANIQCPIFDWIFWKYLISTWIHTMKFNPKIFWKRIRNHLSNQIKLDIEKKPKIIVDKTNLYRKKAN